MSQFNEAGTVQGHRLLQASPALTQACRGHPGVTVQLADEEENTGDSARGVLWARSVSDMYHFGPPSIGGGTFDWV